MTLRRQGGGWRPGRQVRLKRGKEGKWERTAEEGAAAEGPQGHCQSSAGGAAGNGSAACFFRRGMRAEQSLKGRSLVLRMLSGHGRQPVSRIWSLGGGTGEGKETSSLLTV